jgi:hypothetical protein
MAMANAKVDSAYGYLRNSVFQMCNFSHDLAPNDLAFSLPASLHATRSTAFEVTYEFVKIRAICVSPLPIRIYLCSSVVKSLCLLETLHFTRTTAIAKMEQQQLARIQ